MDWTDNDDLTEVSEGNDRSLFGVTGSQRARAGDWYELVFQDNGEEVETDDGVRAAFDVIFVTSNFNPLDSDGEAMEENEEYRLMTGSSRFLSELEAHMPIEGEQYRVTVEDTGYSAEYTIEPAE